MLGKESVVKIVCNSGALKGKIIGVFRGTRAVVGSVVKVAIKEIIPNNENNIKRGDVFKAVIIRTKSPSKYKNKGYSVSFSDNAAVLIKNSGEKLGTSFKGFAATHKKDDPFASAVAKATLGGTINVK